MKKILLVALMALCGVSFSFGDYGCLEECKSNAVINCNEKCVEIPSQNKSRACTSDCNGKYFSSDTLEYCKKECKE